MPGRRCNHVFVQGRRAGQRCNVCPRGDNLYCAAHRIDRIRMNDSESDTDSDIGEFIPDNHNITPISEPQRRSRDGLQGIQVACDTPDTAIMVEEIVQRMMERGLPINEIVRAINDIPGAHVISDQNRPQVNMSNIDTIELSVEKNTYALIEKDEICPICLDQIHNTKFPSEIDEEDGLNGPGFRTACQHVFHKKCLKEYIAYNNNENPVCPTCRHPNCNKYLKNTITLPIKKKQERKIMSCEELIELYKEQPISARDYIINKLLE